MEMRSSLYECSMMHKRMVKRNMKFHYNYFMFFLNLDEIDSLAGKLKLFSRNKFNAFSFRDKDHLTYKKPDVKYNLLQYLKSNGIVDKVGSIYLLTNVSTFGYNFNPVSFYFCFDNHENPLCAVPEVGNTFGELKPFFIGTTHLSGEKYSARIQKNFYVSPFIEHDIYFDFSIQIPGESFTIKIDDYKNNSRIFASSLHGKRKELTDLNLLYYSLKYPLVTLKVIISIHYQALKLYFNKIRFFRKNEFSELQKGAILKWKEQST